jgi:hypothetical protein
MGLNEPLMWESTQLGDSPEPRINTFGHNLVLTRRLLLFQRARLQIRSLFDLEHAVVQHRGCAERPSERSAHLLPCFGFELLLRAKRRRVDRHDAALTTWVLEIAECNVFATLGLHASCHRHALSIVLRGIRNDGAERHDRRRF